MDRRSFLTTTAAAGAMLATTRGAIAETERPAGETGVVLPASPEAKLPLGVLPNTPVSCGKLPVRIDARDGQHSESETM